MKRTGAIILVLLAAILVPVLIWVGLVVVIRQPILRVIKQAGVFSLVFLAGILAPVLIWVGLFSALKELGEEYHLKRAPYRTIAEIIGTAGLSIQKAESSEELVEENAIFMPRPMSEIVGIFAQAGL
jgi:hypothetical protein